MSSTETASHNLACMEIWGGNHRVARTVELPGLAGWVYSQPLPGHSNGGDLHYLSVCSQGRLARVGLADVSGHGQAVSGVADCLRTLMREHINTFDQSDLLRSLNRTFQQQCVSGMKFASVILLGIHGRPGEPDSGRMVFSNAGQPRPLWYRSAQKSWEQLKETAAHDEAGLADLPLGIIPGTNYRQSVVQLEAGDLVLLYSDGLLAPPSPPLAGQAAGREVRNPQDELLGEERLLELARTVPVDSPAAAGEALLAEVEKFRQGAPARDDETLLVLQLLPA